jgi:hypothetical protein
MKWLAARAAEADLGQALGSLRYRGEKLAEAFDLCCGGVLLLLHYGHVLARHRGHLRDPRKRVRVFALRYLLGGLVLADLR